ncbi:MAG: NUDIX domain-containing protein [Gammaproteobacteria bacterium]|nr:MAG: NUDIX domain-containing protein [Gammaproteobacteria bacterium]
MDKPQVGVAVLVIKQGRLLLGQRRKSPGYGSWQCPGGWLHWQESVFDCARREVLEETGMRLDRLVYGSYSNNIFTTESSHSVTLYVAAVSDDEPQDLEAHLASHWQWFAFNELPSPLFLPLQELLDHHYDWVASIFQGR